MAKAKTPGGRRPMGNRSGQSQSPAAAQTITVEADAPRKPRTSPLKFFNQVDAERRKIVWPSRKETWITSVMVLIMVLLAAAFFWIVDAGLSVLFQAIIAFGS